MKNSKKNWLLIWVFLLLWYGCYFVGCGLNTTTEVWFSEYTYSQENKSLTLKNIQILSSIGYVRSYSSSQEENKLFLTFYKCFWGINSSWGAKDSFTIELDPKIEEIYFWKWENATLILEKDWETWERKRG